MTDSREAPVCEPAGVVVTGARVARDFDFHFGADGPAGAGHDVAPLHPAHRHILTSRPWEDRVTLGLESADDFVREEAHGSQGSSVVDPIGVLVPLEAMSEDKGSVDRELGHTSRRDIDRDNVSGLQTPTS